MIGIKCISKMKFSFFLFVGFHVVVECRNMTWGPRCGCLVEGDWSLVE